MAEHTTKSSKKPAKSEKTETRQASAMVLPANMGWVIAAGVAAIIGFAIITGVVAAVTIRAMERHDSDDKYRMNQYSRDMRTWAPRGGY